MNRERDKRVIQVFLDCYNTVGGTDYRVRSYPDEETRNSKRVDALCVNSHGKTLALEHTRLEAFPGEMSDTARFMAVMGQYDKDPALVEAGFHTAASIPVASIANGIHWETLSNDIGVFLRNCFPFRNGTYTFVQGHLSIPLTITKLATPTMPGSFLVERTWPGKSNEATIEKCFAEKLPKLECAVADVKILLLEQPGIAAAASQDLINYGEKPRHPKWLPDEIWLLRTAALETERYVHVSEQHPIVNNRMASWKNGQVTLRVL
jgi:hypothetical protein